MKFVFAKEFLQEKNVTAAFRARIARGKYVLRMAAANCWRIFLNGEFLGYGPMRTAHGYALVHERTLCAEREENFLVVEAAAYNVNSYYTILQQPFFGAELEGVDGAPSYSTDDFACFHLDDRVKGIEKYSMQRTFAEAYEMKEGRLAFYLGAGRFPPSEVVRVKGPELLESGLSEPTYAPVAAERVVGEGKARIRPPERYYDDVWFYKGNRWKADGFAKEELSLHLLREIQEIAFDGGAGKWREYAFPCNKTGFVSLHVRAKGKAAVYLLFDELHPILPWRMCAVNALKYTLAPGEYELLSFEPYTMMYVKVVVFGDAEAEAPVLLSYENPDVKEFPILPDEEAERIFRAAKETFAQNAVDVLTDCPSRERSGWLCDSYFTAQAEHALTGKSCVERNLLRAYLLAPEPVSCQPFGMLPQCYPSDHSDGSYIANWALWLVLELKDHLARSKDEELVRLFRGKVMRLFAFLRRFENEDGLLEDVGGWVFVEWSRANDFTEGVNYPSNMLYSAALRAAGELYGEKKLLEKGEKVAKRVREQSFNGTFFADNAVRREGVPERTENTSETCQYYAFFFGIADQKSHPALFERMFEGSRALLREKYPSLWPSNAFIGNVLRLSVLAREGRREQLLREIKECYLYMAQRTGTLWENNEPTASCCHGFASVAAVWLKEIFLDKCGEVR